MVWFWVTLIVVVVIAIVLFFMSVKIVKQYERGVVLRFGRLHSVREPGIRFIIPIVDVMTKVSLRIVTVPIQSQGIITQDNVSVGVSAVAYYRIVDPVKSVIAIENVQSAIDQIAQTTLRKVVGQHHLDETLAETAKLNVNIREILDETTVDWGAQVTLVELKDILLPDSMKRAMAKQAEAEREKRAKIIAAEGEALAAVQLGVASDTMMAHPLALQLRTLQTLVEVGVDKNTLVVLPAPLMGSIGELTSFIDREAESTAQVRSGDGEWQDLDEELSILPAARVGRMPQNERVTSNQTAPRRPAPTPRGTRPERQPHAAPSASCRARRSTSRACSARASSCCPGSRPPPPGRPRSSPSPRCSCSPSRSRAPSPRSPRATPTRAAWRATCAARSATRPRA